MTAVPALAVDNLSVEFRTRSGVVKALENVSFAVEKGETIAIVGESGSGKSVTAYAVMGILDPAGRVTSGTARLGALDMLSARRDELAEVRGREIAMIFQNPRTALNPIRPVGRQIADVLVRHGNVTRADAPERAVELLRSVGISDPARRARAFPFEMSGGMCQRVMIAIALAARPSLLIADEPTTGLDVTTQAVIMDLIGDLAAEIGMATIFITHDLALAAQRAARIVVMHAGHVVEFAPTRELFERPRHPYTAELIAATPDSAADLGDLAAIPGALPDLRRADLPPCRYSERCPRRQPVCDNPLPKPQPDETHVVACWNPLGAEDEIRTRAAAPRASAANVVALSEERDVRLRAAQGQRR
jgi:peptide/nickel transport system ATP-binding protein